MSAKWTLLAASVGHCEGAEKRRQHGRAAYNGICDSTLYGCQDKAQGESRICQQQSLKAIMNRPLLAKRGSGLVKSRGEVPHLPAR